MLQETIVAQCTAQASGALALVRISGPNTRSIAHAISALPTQRSLLDVPTHTVHYGWIVDSIGTRIDQVLFIVMDGPKTFTGEDTIEITCHNNKLIIEQIITLICAQGARIAQRGEFAQQAFINGKIDLLQAEAINDLIHAQTHQALKLSLSQVQSSLSHWVAQAEQTLLTCIAYCESSFEFLDEEMEFGTHIKQHLQTLMTDITRVGRSFNHQQQLREGVRIALIGSVNAGKSSLFNAMIGQKRSIVTHIAGTTRDSIEAHVQWSDFHCTLVDTAGLRTTDDCIEQEGIRRSFEEAARADIIILAIDSSRIPTEQEIEIYNQLLHDYAHKIIIAPTKGDQTAAFTVGTIKTRECTTLEHPVSAETGLNMPNLEYCIQNKAQALLNSEEAPFLLNQRQCTLIQTLENQIQTILPMLDGPIAYELVSFHLKEALQCIGELTGKEASERAMDTVFRQFCVGK